MLEIDLQLEAVLEMLPTATTLGTFSNAMLFQISHMAKMSLVVGLCTVGQILHKIFDAIHPHDKARTLKVHGIAILRSIYSSMVRLRASQLL